MKRLLFSISAAIIISGLSCSDNGIKGDSIPIGIAGELWGVGGIDRVVCMLSGDNITGSVSNEMEFDTSKNIYSGSISRPVSGSEWTLTIKVYDTLGHKTGQYSKIISESNTLVTLKKFNAENAIPELSISAPYSCRINDEISITGTIVDSFDGTVTIYCDIGNTGTYKKTSRIDTTFRAPSEPGDFICNFKIIDDDGNIVIHESGISVKQGAPVASASANPSTITNNDSVWLLGTAQVSYGIVEKWEWSIGNDGVFTDVSPDSTLLIPKVSFTDDFTAVLRVTDDIGNQAFDTVGIGIITDKPTAELATATKKTGINSEFTIQCASTDKFGSIVRRELDPGNTGTFIDYSGEDTLLLSPSDGGTFEIVERVTDDDGETALCTLIVSIIAPPDEPVLLVPADGAEDLDIDSGFTVAWRTSARANKYRVEVAPDSAFSQIMDSRNTRDTTYLQTSLNKARSYFWHVKALDTIMNQESDWSATRRFIVENDLWGSETKVPCGYSIIGHATGCVDSNLYIMGGTRRLIESDTEGVVNLCWMYDIGGKKWSEKSAMPVARTNSGGCVYDNRIYLFGGTSSINKTDSNESVLVYDPAADEWSVKALMPTIRSDVGVAALENKIYIIGGQRNGTSRQDVEEYDPATDSWAIKNNFPIRITGMATAVVDSVLYVLGGYEGGARDVPIKKVFKYDRSADQWIALPAMPCGAGDFGAVVHDGKIYMAGGNTDCTSLKTREFNPEKDEWKMKAVAPFGWKKYGIAACGNAMYLSGGLSTGNISNAFKGTTNVYFYIP